MSGVGLTAPGSDAQQASIDLIKAETDKMPRVLSGTIAILEAVETLVSGGGGGSTSGIPEIMSGVAQVLTAVNNTYSADLSRNRLTAGMATTYFKQLEVASGISLNGTGWVSLITVSPVSTPTKITGVTVNTSGSFSGTPMYRITNGYANDYNKLFPHGTHNEITPGNEDIFQEPVTVVVHPTNVNLATYVLQVRSTDANDTGANGCTAAAKLNIIEVNPW